jgi:hypothetical protein
MGSFDKISRLINDHRFVVDIVPDLFEHTQKKLKSVTEKQNDMDSSNNGGKTITYPLLHLHSNGAYATTSS